MQEPIPYQAQSPLREIGIQGVTLLISGIASLSLEPHPDALADKAIVNARLALITRVRSLPTGGLPLQCS